LTENCAAKKECDRIVAAAKKPPSSSNIPITARGQLRHITEDIMQDSVDGDNIDVEYDILGYDTNEDALLYFECICIL